MSKRSDLAARIIIKRTAVIITTFIQLAIILRHWWYAFVLIWSYRRTISSFCLIFLSLRVTRMSEKLSSWSGVAESHLQATQKDHQSYCCENLHFHQLRSVSSLALSTWLLLSKVAQVLSVTQILTVLVYTPHPGQQHHGKTAVFLGADLQLPGMLRLPILGMT